MSYATRVLVRLGPYSVSKLYPDLLREWYATGCMEDVEDAVEECDVCGHEHIRYLFQIKNTENRNIRDKSGSKCILKFPEIGVLVGQRITYDPTEKQSIISDIIERHKKERRARARKESARQVWAGLQGKQGMPAPVNAMLDISARIYHDPETNASLTPKQFSLFLWAAQIAKATVDIAAFQGIMNLRKGKSKLQLAELKWRQIESMAGAFTPAQLAILRREREGQQ